MITSQAMQQCWKEPEKVLCAAQPPASAAMNAIKTWQGLLREHPGQVTRWHLQTLSV